MDNVSENHFLQPTFRFYQKKIALKLLPFYTLGPNSSLYWKQANSVPCSEFWDIFPLQTRFTLSLWKYNLFSNEVIINGAPAEMNALKRKQNFWRSSKLWYTSPLNSYHTSVCSSIKPITICSHRIMSPHITTTGFNAICCLYGVIQQVFKASLHHFNNCFPTDFTVSPQTRWHCSVSISTYIKPPSPTNFTLFLVIINYIKTLHL